MHSLFRRDEYTLEDPSSHTPTLLLTKHHFDASRPFVDHMHSFAHRQLVKAKALALVHQMEVTKSRRVSKENRHAMKKIVNQLEHTPVNHPSYVLDKIRLQKARECLEQSEFTRSRAEERFELIRIYVEAIEIEERVWRRLSNEVDSLCRGFQDLESRIHASTYLHSLQNYTSNTQLTRA